MSIIYSRSYTQQLCNTQNERNSVSITFSSSSITALPLNVTYPHSKVKEHFSSKAQTADIQTPVVAACADRILRTSSLAPSLRSLCHPAAPRNARCPAHRLQSVVRRLEHVPQLVVICRAVLQHRLDGLVVQNDRFVLCALALFILSRLLELGQPHAIALYLADLALLLFV